MAIDWKAIGIGAGVVALGAVGITAVMSKGSGPKGGKVNKKLTPADIEADAHIDLALERGTNGYIVLKHCEDSRAKDSTRHLAMFTPKPEYSLHSIRYFAVRMPGQEPCFDIEVGRFVNGTVEIANVVTDGPLVETVQEGMHYGGNNVWLPAHRTAATDTLQAILDFAAGKESLLQPSEVVRV